MPRYLERLALREIGLDIITAAHGDRLLTMRSAEASRRDR